jgi:CBS domain containing-hemolysin-like protein
VSPAFLLGLVALLIAANGFFVAAEFALVSVRRAPIEDAAARGDRSARAVLHQLQRLTLVLSAAQFGITVTSLLVGFLAEGAIGDTLIVPLVDAVGLPPESSRAISISAAFLLSTGHPDDRRRTGPKERGHRTSRTDRTLRRPADALSSARSWGR